MVPKSKLIFFICLFYSLSTPAFTQTYLSPIVGYELTHYIDPFRRTTDTPSFTTIMTPSTQNNFNLLFGLEIQQKLGEKFSLVFQHTWSRKHVWSRRHNSPSIDDEFTFSGVAFRYNRNSLFLKYNLTNNLSLGLGHSFNRYRKTNIVLYPSEPLTTQRNILNATPPSNKLDYGITSSLSYQIAQFSLELQYHYTYRIVVTDTSSPTLFLPPKAVSLSVAYRFKILNAPSFSGWNRKEGCPTF